MPTGTFEFRDDNERLAMENAIAFVAQMRDLALQAPPGQVLDRCERHALENGRELLRLTLERSAQAAAVSGDEKKGARVPALAVADSVSNVAADARS